MKLLSATAFLIATAWGSLLWASEPTLPTSGSVVFREICPNDNQVELTLSWRQLSGATGPRQYEMIGVSVSLNNAALLTSSDQSAWLQDMNRWTAKSSYLVRSATLSCRVSDGGVAVRLRVTDAYEPSRVVDILTAVLNHSPTETTLDHHLRVHRVGANGGELVLASRAEVR